MQAENGSIPVSSKSQKLPMWQKIVIGMIAGVIVGSIFGHKALIFKPIGELFINAIRMLIVPVIFTASVCAVLSMSDIRKMRRISLKTFAIYLISMSIATFIGLVTAHIIAPGAGLLLPTAAHSIAASSTPSFGDAIANLIPSNPVAAFEQGNILQILIFALFFGIALNMAGEKAAPVKQFFNSLSPVVFKLTEIVFSFAPLGIFALMATTAGEYGFATLLPLLKFVLTAYSADIILFIVLYVPVIFLLAKIKPTQFLKHISEALLFAFSSSSSAATLPISMRCAENNLGISKQLTGFLLPLGISFNMNGLAIYVSIATVFSANIFGIHLGLSQYLLLLVTIVLTSMGAAGIPGSALIVMGAVMTAVGLPLGAIPLIAGVDRIVDMAQTTTNVAGDLFTATLIAKLENDTQVPAKVIFEIST